MLCAFALLDIVLIYGLVEPSVPPAVAVAVAGAAAIAIGGSFLAVVAREYGVSGRPSPTEKSSLVRTTEVIVAITDGVATTQRTVVPRSIHRTIISIKLKGARVDGQCIWQTSSPTISTT